METAKKVDQVLPAQKLAASPRHSAWVSASAGTGKTKVLTDRVLRLLLNGTPPHKILCLTFTNAAAAEMSARVNDRLKEWAIKPDKELAKDLYELLAEAPDKEIIALARRLFTMTIDGYDRPKIMTIHSFCQYLLAKFPIEAGLPTRFKVIDEYESDEFLRESYTRLLSDAHKNAAIKESVDWLACSVSDMGLSGVIKIIIGERKKILSLINKKDASGELVYKSVSALVGATYSYLGVKKGDTRDDILRDFFAAAPRGKLKKLAEFLKHGTEKDAERSAAIDSWLSGDGLSGFDDYRSVFLLKDEAEAKHLSKVITGKPLKKFPEAERIIMDEQESLSGVIEKINSLEIARLTEAILHISEHLISIYENLKRRRAVMDFNDLIHNSHSLLGNREIAPWVMYKMDGGIDHVLVDEAQDTSEEQWQIVQSLCEEFFVGEGAREVERTLFVVGDEKQSIFSVQGADTKMFHKMLEQFSNTARSSKHKWETLSLDKSFRSTEPVLQAVDAVFSDHALRAAITADALEIRHDLHRRDAPGKVELWPLVKSEKEEKSDGWVFPVRMAEEKEAKTLLAERIAERIKEWLQDERALPARGRVITPGDITILVRHRDEFVGALVKKLKQENIPVAGIDRLELEKHIAVMDLVALGNFCLLPEDDLNLAVVLKGPLVGFNEEQLYLVCYGRGKRSVWEALKELAKNDEKMAEAVAYLRDVKGLAARLPVFEFYTQILDTLGGRKRLAARLGVEIHDPVNEFLNLCMDYERNHTQSLQAFLHWFADRNIMIKRNLENDSNTVKIMTVHAAKGLQAPVIFLADTTYLPQGKPSGVFWTKEGLLLWAGTRENYNRICNKLFAEEKKAEYEEYIRLLYVAMTRAEDELYICGGEGERAVNKQSWYSIVEKALGNLAQKEADGSFVIANYNNKYRSEKITASKKTDTKMPGFLMQKLSQESVSKSYADYSGKRADSQEMERGRAIHKLLELLPHIDKATRKKVGEMILERYFGGLENKKSVVSNVVEFIGDKNFAWIFGSGSQAEVEISGVVDGEIVFKRLDRIVFGDKKITIVDYKTDSNPPDAIPSAYKDQLLGYKSIMSAAHPGKEIRSFILWTENLTLCEVN